MATTARTARTKSAKTEEETLITEAEATPKADEHLIAPALDTAPLEAPQPRAKPEPPVPDSTQVWALPADLTDWLFAAHTGEAPDPDSVFTKVFEYGNVEECQVRLLELVRIPPYGNEVTRLLLPQGAHVSVAEAERIRVRLREQLDRQSVAS